jgi:hypothetical protein
MKTAMELTLARIEMLYGMKPDAINWEMFKNDCIEKEKEQIQKAFSDGQETPINHLTLPHYSRDEYYNDNYNQNK